MFSARCLRHVETFRASRAKTPCGQRIIFLRTLPLSAVVSLVLSFIVTLYLPCRFSKCTKNEEKKFKIQNIDHLHYISLCSLKIKFILICTSIS